MNRLKDTVLKPVGDQFDRLTELILRQLSITRQLLAGNSSAELRDELNRNESAIDGLEVSIRDTGYIAILAVASGHLLAAVGDDNLLVQARSQYNIPGAPKTVCQV